MLLFIYLNEIYNIYFLFRKKAVSLQPLFEKMWRLTQQVEHPVRFYRNREWFWLRARAESQIKSVD